MCALHSYYDNIDDDDDNDDDITTSKFGLNLFSTIEGKQAKSHLNF